MKYFVLIAHSPTGWSSMSADEQAESMNDHVRFHQAVGEPVLTDGPFAETAEMIGGFYLLDAPDLDTVVEWCRILPHGYSLEIRPCVQIDLPG